MDKRYEAYCLTDPEYYDQSVPRAGRDTAFPAADREPPAGWSTNASADWWHVTPDDHRLPDQGWKIHVSATMRTAEKVLDVVWDYCVGSRLAFKFIRGPKLLFLRNSKYADRAAAASWPPSTRWTKQSSNTCSRNSASCCAASRAHTFSVICATATGRSTCGTAPSPRAAAWTLPASSCRRSRTPPAP